VGKEKATGALKDHAWFVSFAPRDHPRIAMATLIENVGQGGRFSAPTTREIYEAYKAKLIGGSERTDIIATPAPALTTKALADAEPKNASAH
jgi:penicillin-binding protein 2